MKVTKITTTDFLHGTTARLLKELNQAREDMRKAKKHIRNAVNLCKNNPELLDELKKYFHEEIETDEQSQ